MNEERRSGFTLIEVLVALTIMGMVVLMAHPLLTVVTASARALQEARRVTDQHHLGQRWLRLALGSLEAGEDGASFHGQRDRLQFSSWLLVAEGWTRRHRLTLRVANGALVAEGVGADPLVLEDSVVNVDFDYLLEPGANTSWVRVWQSPISAPLAVRCRIARSLNGRIETDTMLYLIRARG